jgi:hypothetical protein
MIFRMIFCTCLLLAPGAKADELGIEIFTDAISYAVTCTQITYHIDNLNALALRHHLDMSEGSAHMKRMLEVGERKRLALTELPMTTVCADGLLFYGPRGIKHPGLLWK